MKHWNLILLFASLPLIAVDCRDPIVYTPFSIRVVDESGNPLENVHVYSYAQGGSDWGLGHYEVSLTDRYGWVELDGYGSGKNGAFRLTNYFPIDSTLYPDATYILTAAPYISTSLATLEGDKYYFYNDGIVSLTRRAFYRYYPLTESGVTAPASVQLQFEGNTYSTMFFADELWLANYDGAIFRYNLSNPHNPSILNRYNFPNQVSLLAIENDVVLLYGSQAKRVSVLEISGDSLVQRSTFPTTGYPQISLRNRRLIMLNGNGFWGYDITDLTHPLLVNPNQTSQSEWAFFLDTLMVRRIYDEYPNDSSRYQIYDIRDPAFPVLSGNFTSPGVLSRLADMEHGYADYFMDHYWEEETYLMMRQPNSPVFGLAGFSLSGVSAAKGNLAIGSNVLYRWSAR